MDPGDVESLQYPTKESPVAPWLSSLENSCGGRGRAGRDVSITLGEIILHAAWGAPYGCPDTAQRLPKRSWPQQRGD